MNELSEEDLAQIVEVVCTTVLGLPVESGVAEDMAVRESMTASVVITGAWNGTVKVMADFELVSYAASRMFEIDLDQVHKQDRIDSLSELTNMVAGIAKSLLPPSCDLAIPVSLGSDQQDLHDPLWRYFNCGAYPVAVSVIKSADEGLLTGAAKVA